MDFLLAIPGYEENIVTRAVEVELDGMRVWMCSPEDLIIQKAVANRTRDWEDVEGILIEQHGRLDVKYIEDWLSQFAEILDRPDILDRYHGILEVISRLAQ